MNLLLLISLYTSINGMYAQNLLACKGFGPTKQEWGFVTVRQGAHMFWWLHQAAGDNHLEKPLIIWLQGGPGTSSTGFGNFGELGPLNEDLKPRSVTWVNDYNVLFVDNPVGTGYSQVDCPQYFATTNKQVAEDFLVLLKGFYDKVPEFKKCPLYIVGESYGGKMAAEIALELDKAVKDGVFGIKLASVGLGDAWISPIDSVLSWGPYLLNLGFVDRNGYEQIQEKARATKGAVDKENYTQATQLYYAVQKAIFRVTENIDVYNVFTKIPAQFKFRRGIMKPGPVENLDKKIYKLMNNEVKEGLGLNVTWGGQREDVFKAMSGDFMKPVTEIVELLLNTTDIQVATYNGQLDLIVDTPGTVAWVDQIKFSGAKKWKKAIRKPILEKGSVEGYYKKVGNFAMYWVSRAGHMVPSDNPDAMNFILRDITDDRNQKCLEMRKFNTLGLK